MNGRQWAPKWSSTNNQPARGREGRVFSAAPTAPIYVAATFVYYFVPLPGHVREVLVLVNFANSEEQRRLAAADRTALEAQIVELRRQLDETK